MKPAHTDRAGRLTSDQGVGRCSCWPPRPCAGTPGGGAAGPVPVVGTTARLCSCLGFDAFPAKELRLSLSPSPPLDSHLPSPTRPGHRSSHGVAGSVRTTPGHRALPAFRGKTACGPFQANCCDRRFSQARDSVRSFPCTLLTFHLQNFCLFLIERWMCWGGIWTYYIYGYQIGKKMEGKLSEECMDQSNWGDETDLQS